MGVLSSSPVRGLLGVDLRDRGITARVFKYPVSLTDTFTVSMPELSTMLTIQMQNGKPYMWALVDPESSLVERRFRLAGTGHPINERVGYVGTFQLGGGSMVFHLFEVES
jgi:hypothetical protein